MQRGQLWCCDVFPCFIGISGCFGVLERRIYHLSLSGPKMAFLKLPKHYVLQGKWPILKRKMLGKNAKRTNGTHFTRAQGGAVPTRAEWGGGEERLSVGNLGAGAKYFFFGVEMPTK